MEPEQTTPVAESNDKFASLKKVTPLSKYLAMTLFIVMPFIGGWIGYTYAPGKVTETELESILSIETKQSSTTKLPTSIIVNDVKVGHDSYFKFSTTTEFTNFSVLEKDSPEARLITRFRKEEKFSGSFSWGGNLPSVIVKATELSSTLDPECDYGCRPDVIVRLDYYTYNTNYDLVLFYTEEMHLGHTQEIEYVLLASNRSSNTNTNTNTLIFLQSIKNGYCCDASGSVENRVFEVDLINSKTIVKNINRII